MMNLPDKGNTELGSYRFDLEITRDVIMQLEKDILLSGSVIEIPTESYTDLFLLKEAVTHFIANISTTNPSMFFNILYRIDAQFVFGNDPQEMAELILKRELLKVLTRRFYRE